MNEHKRTQQEIFAAFRITYSYDVWPGTLPLQYSQPTEDLGAAADTLASAAWGGPWGCLAPHRAGSPPSGLHMELEGQGWADFLLNSTLFSKLLR